MVPGLPKERPRAPHHPFPFHPSPPVLPHPSSMRGQAHAATSGSTRHGLVGAPYILVWRSRPPHADFCKCLTFWVTSREPFNKTTITSEHETNAYTFPIWFLSANRIRAIHVHAIVNRKTVAGKEKGKEEGTGTGARKAKNRNENRRNRFLTEISYVCLGPKRNGPKGRNRQGRQISCVCV